MKRGGFIKEYLSSFVIGLIFGLGLMVSGICRISKVLGFLTINKSWDPTILFLFITCFLINMITFRLMIQGRPMYAADFNLHRSGRISG